MTNQAHPWPFLCRPGETFGYRLWQVTHAWQRRFEAALAPLDLTHMQFVVLAKAAWLAHAGEVPSQSRIACTAAIDRMMVSKIVRLLEAKGFLARAPHPDDPRANRVDLTAEGRAVLAQAVPIMKETQSAFFGRLGEDGMAALAGELDRLLRHEGIFEQGH
jgi:DNA-binding MarR family transcriptional regulator